MANPPTHLHRLARVSISILPPLVLAIFIFGAFYASISLLNLKSPLPLCGGGTSSHQAFCKSRKTLSNLLLGSNLPSLTIFTAPTRPFSNSSDDPQYQALLSWLRLQPTPKIVLVGKDPSFYRVSKQLCDEVSVEPNIDYNMWGTPHVHSMFARAQQADTDFSMVVDSNILLFQDAMEALHRVHHNHEKWILFGKPRAMDPKDFGVAFMSTGSPGLVDVISTIAGFSTSCKEIAALVMLQGSLQGTVSYWAWNNLNKKQQAIYPLLHRSIPPFSYVKGTFEGWILQHLIEDTQSHRILIEATEVITSVTIASNFTSESPSTEEAHINRMLSHGGDQGLSSLPAPWKLVRCAEPKIQCLVEQEKETSTLSNTSNNVESQDAILQLSSLSSDDAVMSNLRTLDMLLPQVADENKVVVMVGGTSNYKEMLLSFICRAQSLGIQNVLIAAFDEGLYEYAYLQGLPVYLETSSDKYRSSIGSDKQCIFASECFKRVSKLKSMSVLRVLKKGYSVLWSDMDIAWFENPLPQLLALASEPNTLLIQSDEPNENFPENSILGANSGFYLARSNEKTIHAFETITEHAMKSEFTEQPSFYIILCGEKGERRVGNRECLLEKGGLRTVFLSHKQYPNGNVFRHWDSPDATESCKGTGCVLLHNNYIAGKENKLTRFIEHGLWFYDVNNRMCIQPWHPMRPTKVSPATFRASFLNSLNITQPPL